MTEIRKNMRNAAVFRTFEAKFFTFQGLKRAMWDLLRSSLARQIRRAAAVAEAEELDGQRTALRRELAEQREEQVAVRLLSIDS